MKKAREMIEAVLDGSHPTDVIDAILQEREESHWQKMEREARERSARHDAERRERERERERRDAERWSRKFGR